MRFQTLPQRNCVTRLKLDPRRMARPASVIFPQWSNPIVTRGLANLLLSCEMRSPTVDARHFPFRGTQYTEIRRMSNMYSYPPRLFLRALLSRRCLFLSYPLRPKQNHADLFINDYNDESRGSSWTRVTLPDFSLLPILIHLIDDEIHSHVEYSESMIILLRTSFR